MKGDDEIMQTTPVRIDSDVLDIVRSYKSATGVPMQRFIEEAIVEKIAQLPVDVQSKMGLTKVYSKYADSMAAFVINGSKKKKKKP